MKHVQAFNVVMLWRRIQPGCGTEAHALAP
jgi:hypothetical protein